MILFLIILAAAALKVLWEYERVYDLITPGVDRLLRVSLGTMALEIPPQDMIFRLGRLIGAKGPGLIFIHRNEREEKIVRMRFGIGEKHEHTLEEVGQDFSLTRERIRQIEDRALRKLRRSGRTNKLRNFIKN